MSWSKLLRTSLGEAVENAMNTNGLEYHNFEHVLAGYDFLEETGTQYDANLDVAWLCHDVVYDKESEKEIRSAMWMMNAINKQEIKLGTGPIIESIRPQECVHLIRMTERHSLSYDSTFTEKAIVMADLNGLANPNDTESNYGRIMRESMKLYGISLTEVTKGNLAFMENLLRTVDNNMSIDTENRDYWWRVREGVLQTMQNSRMVLGDIDGVWRC